MTDGPGGRVAVTAPAGTAGAGTALVLVLLVLVAAIAWLVRLPRPGDDLATTVEPVVVPVPSADAAVERPVQLRVLLGATLSSFSPVDGGVVTAVLVRPGDVVRTGTRVVEVSGVTRMAAHTRRPFFRVLGVGDRGADVDQLGSLLSQLGLRHGPRASGRPFDVAMAAAVRRLATSLGGSPDGRFDPSWVIWLPEPELVVASVQAQAGGPAPGPGQPLVTYAPTVRSAVVVGYARDPVAPVGDGLEVRGVSTAHLRLQGGAVVLDAISRAVLTSAVASAPTGAGTGGDSTDGTGTAARSVTIGAVRVTRWRDDVVDVPVAGILTRPDATACVVVRSSDAWRPVGVDVLGSDPATLQAEVRGVSVGAHVVANPEAAGLADRCTDTQ